MFRKDGKPRSRHNLTAERHKTLAVAPRFSRSRAQRRTPNLSTLIDQARHKLLICRADRSPRRDDLDQCPATIQTTIRRLELLLARIEFKNECMLLLGDDDLLSVAINATGLSTSLTVIDLDAFLLSRISDWTRPAHVVLLHHDLRLGLPKNLAESYDIIFADPPYTTAGQLNFLKAGITAMRRLQSSSLFLCASRLYLRPEQIGSIIDAAEVAGLELTKIYEDFNEYDAPPDVVQDIQHRKFSDDASRFHSSLFHFRPREGALNAESLSALPTEIYEYEE